MIRIWRQYVLSQKDLTLGENFLTLNCYVCIELNAHSLVLLLLYLNKTHMPHLFLPHLFGSQQCEAIFRQIRSFTSTYSTVANCSVKEILSRISKILLQNEISFNYNSFKFPRLGHHQLKIFKQEMPTKQEILEEIEKCKRDAINDALHIGLLKKEDSKKVDFRCIIKPHDSNVSIRKKSRNYQPPPKISTKEMKSTLLQFSNISLTNSPVQMRE